MSAVSGGSVAIVEVLLAAGVDVRGEERVSEMDISIAEFIGYLYITLMQIHVFDCISCRGRVVPLCC